MTDRTKFEAMLEALINEDHEAAKDIFHNIVVGKSREIYEKLLAEEFEEEESDDEDDTDSFGDDEEGDDEGDDDFGGFGDDEGEDDDEFGDEEGDDEFGDEEGDEFGDDEFGDEEDGDLENRVLDLEDALDELKSEFEQLLAGEEDEPEHDDMFGGDEIGGDMGMGGDEFGAGEEENEFQSMFEYVNKVALPKHGDNGVNNKSIFNKAKYNDMGGVAPKFAGESKGEGTKGGLLNPSAGDLTSGLGTIQNRPDSKAGKTAFKKREPGHGPETKGRSPDNGQNTTSVLRGRGSK